MRAVRQASRWFLTALEYYRNGALVILFPAHTHEQVFPISATCLRLAWNRARNKAGITDLRFHDLRHEAVSRFFEMGMSVPEVALIYGHKDVRQLFRYTHLNSNNVFKKYEAF
jgi:integrase